MGGRGVAALKGHTVLVLCACIDRQGGKCRGFRLSCAIVDAIHLCLLFVTFEEYICRGVGRLLFCSLLL